VPPAFVLTVAADMAATTEDRKMQKRIFILISATTLAISTAAQVGAIDLNRPHRENERDQ